MSVVIKDNTDLKDKYQEYINKGAEIQSNYRTVRWGTYWDRDIAMGAVIAALIGGMILPFWIGFIIGGLVGYSFMTEKKSKETRQLMSAAYAKLNEEYKNPVAGMVGEEDVNSVLKKFNVYVLNDVKISHDSKRNPCQIDHVVIGPFGILCIETKNLRSGAYNTKPDNPDMWVGGGREFYNPQKQAKGHVYVLVKCLTASGIRSAKSLVKPIVVLTNKNCVYENLSTQHGDVPVLSLSELSDYLEEEFRRIPILRQAVQRRFSSIISLMCEK